MAQDTSSMSNDALQSSAGTSPPAIRVIPTSSSMNAESGLSDESSPPIVSSRIVERSALADAEEPSHHHSRRGGANQYDMDDDDFVDVGHEDLEEYAWTFDTGPPGRSRSQMDQLHPFVQLLSLDNVDDCVKVEEAFPENERCSREKIVYRLTKCPELSLGIFSLPPPVANQPKPRPTLVAHIVATRTPAATISDATMGVPPDWREKGTIPNGTDTEPLGHQDQGSTIAVHSLAVLEEHQGKGLGTTLMKAYIQRIKDADIATRIALLAHEHLIPFYTQLGFSNAGPSECQFGGGGWTNLVLELNY